MLPYLLQGITFGLSAAVSPGPFQAYLLAQTVQKGWKRTLPSALAPLMSDGPIIVLILLLLTQTPDWLLNGIRILGGIFLIYLAWEAYQAYRRPPSTLQTDPEDRIQGGIFRAALVNALGPGPYLFWGLIAGPILLDGWRTAPPLGLIFVIGFYGTLVGAFASFIILFDTARRLGPVATRMLTGISAIGLLFFGGYQLWQGLSQLR